MKQWVRWWGVSVFVAIVFLWWLCIDIIVKTVIEAVGTEVMGAKVELSHAELDLMPASLKLFDLQLTDPAAPMSNLVVAKQVEATLDSLQLFGRKIIANNMIVSGLQFNTPRKTSGAIKGRLLSKQGVFNSDNLQLGSTIPGLTLPNVDDLVAKEKVKIQKDYNRINTELKTLETQWKQQMDELPDKEKMDEYKKRIKKIKKGNFLTQLSGLKAIKEDINNDQKQIKSLNSQLKSDIKKVKSELNYAKGLPEEHVNSLLSDLGLGDNALDGLATGIMSGQIKQWLQQGLSLIKPGNKTEQKNKKEQPSTINNRGKGTWVHFTDEQPLPELLIRQAKLDGLLSVSGQSIVFTGEANNLTHQPDQWHKPATFSINGRSDTKASVVINGVLDHRAETGKDSVDFRVTDLPLDNYALSENPELQVIAKKALASANGKLLLHGENMDLDVNSLFSGVDLQVTSTKSSSMTSVLVSTLKSVKTFNLAMQLAGPFDEPDVKVRSDLDKLLSKAVGQTIKKETQALKEKLTSQLQAQLAPELQGINKQGDFFSTVEKQLGGKQLELKNLTKNF